MRAFVLHAFDAPPTLDDTPVPRPGPGEVRVRVRYSSVNPVDAATGAGFFRTRNEHRLPAVLGRDVAGTVDALGDGVTTFRIGDEVLAMVKRPYVGDGTFAEYVVVPEDRYVVHRPPSVPVEVAGAVGLVGVTAVTCLDALDCRAGDTILLNGATGGVGAVAVQAAVARGLRVIATARPGAEVRHVRDLGASGTVDWSTGDVAASVRRLRPGGVDGVIDLVSRDSGSFATIAATAAVGATAVSTLSAAPSGGPRMVNVHSDGDPAVLRRVVELLVDGTLRLPVVDVVPLERIATAFELLASRPLGKIGLQVAP